MGGGRLGVKKCGRWEIGGKKMWEVGDGKTMWEVGDCKIYIAVGTCIPVCKIAL